MANEVNILITADDQASKKIDNVTDSTGKLGGVMSSVGKIATGFLAANVLESGFSSLMSGVNNAIEGWKEYLQVSAQTEAVIKSTGGAAGLSAEQIKSMADSLKLASLFEDDAIQNGENLLLTFTNIGGDVFPRATQAMLDMSQALGQDVSQSAIQLGKALNDPIAGVTALRRVGVQLTDAQEEQIKQFMAVNDVASAQNVILTELEKEFGGSAKAASDAAGASAQLDDKMDDLNDTIGQKLLPAQLKLKEAQVAGITFILDQGIPAIESFIQEHQKLFDSIGQVIDGISTVWPLLVPVFEFVGNSLSATIEAMGTSLDGLVNIVSGAVALIDAIVHGDWQAAWDALGQIVGGTKDIVLGFVEALNAGTIGLLQTMGVDIGNIVGGIRDNVVDAFETMGYLAGGAFDLLRDAGVGAFNAMRGAIESAVGTIESLMERLKSALAGALGPLGNILSALNGVIGAAGAAISAVGSAASAVIPGHAAGTSFFGGGLTWVGERGPELVSLPRGSRIYNHAESMAMANGGGGLGPITINARIYLGEHELKDITRTEIDVYQANQRRAAQLYGAV